MPRLTQITSTHFSIANSTLQLPRPTLRFPTLTFHCHFYFSSIGIFPGIFSEKCCKLRTPKQSQDPELRTKNAIIEGAIDKGGATLDAFTLDAFPVPVLIGVGCLSDGSVLGFPHAKIHFPAKIPNCCFMMFSRNVDQLARSAQKSSHSRPLQHFWVALDPLGDADDLNPAAMLQDLFHHSKARCFVQEEQVVMRQDAPCCNRISSFSRLTLAPASLRMQQSLHSGCAHPVILCFNHPTVRQTFAVRDMIPTCASICAECCL